jgi:signal transduction histidine kinase
VVALGVAGVAAAWWLGERSYGVVAGGVAGVATGVAGVHVAYSRMAVTDVLLTTLVTVALALLVTGLELALLLDDGSASLPATVLTVLAGGSLVLRRSHAPAVLAAALVAAIVIVAMGEAPTGLIVLIALYSTAATRERRVSLAALAPTTAVAAVLSVVAADAGASDSSRAVAAVTAGALSVGIWGLGAYAQTQRRYRRELEERAAHLEREREQLTRIAIHEERASIARELHDIVAHSVTVMLIGVRGARDVLRTSPDAARDALANVETSAEQSLVELRRILALLREPERDADSRPQPSLAELDELIADYHEAGLPVRLQLNGTPRPLAGGLELSVYRIVQEALTNVLKHSRATRATVTLGFRETGLEVEIVDDGPAVAEANGATPGQGLVGMRERVALLGGDLQTGRRSGGGFKVAVRVPTGGGT